MNLVKFDKEKHYPALEAIWEFHGWQSCPATFLPKTGLAAEQEDGQFIAALFMYMEFGSVAMVSWAAASPAVPAMTRKKALDTLFEALKKIALENRCTFIYGVTAVERYMNIMESWGMFPVEKNMQSFILPLYNDGIEFLKD
jgi:hypothetical protein